MDDGQSSPLRIDDTDQTLAGAYEGIGIKDPSIPDGDVVAAFHTAYLQETRISDIKQLWSVKALQIISHCRQSRLLEFILTIVPHLTTDNVRILARAPLSFPSAGSPANINNEQHIHESSCINITDGEGAFDPPNATVAIAVPASSQSSNGELNIAPASSPLKSTTSSVDDDGSVFSEEISSTDAPSSGEGSSDSDFDEPIGGKYWNGMNWRCEECLEELVDGKCPYGDIISPCRLCGYDLEAGNCTCTLHEDESIVEGADMVWDNRDEIWRCTTCLWEIEANSEDEGQCHCQIDPGEPIQPLPMTTPTRRIELLYYPDYAPADSDSSGPESVDSEPDSGDESCIEDDGPFEPGLLTLMGPIHPPDELQETERSTTLEDDGHQNANHDSEIMDMTFDE